MAGYEIIEHTADVGVSATGDTFAEALANLALGMFSLITDLELVAPDAAFEVRVSSSEADVLPVDWLNELLFLYETEGLIPCEIEVEVGGDGCTLSAACKGERVDPLRHELRTDVKAATYHQLEVTHEGGWRIRVILDV